MMARPARVRMRTRNPWVLARRRLFGWNVRLPLLTAVILPVLGARFSSRVAALRLRPSGTAVVRTAESRVSPAGPGGALRKRSYPATGARIHRNACQRAGDSRKA
jgi:hypothetical protein